MPPGRGRTAQELAQRAAQAAAVARVADRAGEVASVQAQRLLKQALQQRRGVHRRALDAPAARRRSAAAAKGAGRPSVQASGGCWGAVREAAHLRRGSVQERRQRGYLLQRRDRRALVRRHLQLVPALLLVLDACGRGRAGWAPRARRGGTSARAGAQRTIACVKLRLQVPVRLLLVQAAACLRLRRAAEKRAARRGERDRARPGHAACMLRDLVGHGALPTALGRHRLFSRV